MKPLTAADFSQFPICLSYPPNFNAGWEKTQAIQGTVITGRVNFPNTNGFHWPDKAWIDADIVGGTVYQCVRPGGMDPYHPDLYQLTPAANTFSFLAYQVKDKTPANPTGEFPAMGFIVKFGGGYQLTCPAETTNANKCESNGP